MENYVHNNSIKLNLHLIVKDVIMIQNMTLKLLYNLEIISCFKFKPNKILK